MHAIRRHVQHVLVVAAQVDRGLPIPAERRLTEGVLGVQIGTVASLLVGAGVPTELGAGVDRLVVAGIDLDLHAVSTVEPVVGVVAGLVPTRAGLVAARAAPRAVVLQSTIDAVRAGIVHGHGIELAHCRRVAGGPMLTAVEGDVDATVVAVDEVHRVSRVEPNVVVVDVDVVLGNGGPRAPPSVLSSRGTPPMTTWVSSVGSTSISPK